MATTDSREISPSSSPVNANHAPKFGTLILNRVFVGGIAGNTTEAELHDLFSQYATVKATKIILDRAGVSKGYGFVTFSCESEAKRVLEEPEIMLKDRKLNVAQAIKKQPFSKPYENASATNGPMVYPNTMPYAYQNGMTLYPQTVDPNYNGMTAQPGQAVQMVYSQYYVPQQQYTQSAANVSAQALVGSQYARWQYPNYSQYPQQPQQQQTYLSYSGAVPATNQQSNTSSTGPQPPNPSSATAAQNVHQNLPRIHVNQQPIINGAPSDISSCVVPSDYLTLNAAQQPPCASHMYYPTLMPYSCLPNGYSVDSGYFEQAGHDSSQQCTPNRNSSRTPSPNKPSKGYRDNGNSNKSFHHLVPKVVNGVTVLTYPKTNNKENVINRSSPLTPPPTPGESNCHENTQLSDDINLKFRQLNL